MALQSMKEGPRARGMAVVLLGSSFGLYVFLTTPTDSRFYLFGVGTMLLAFLVSLSSLVLSRVRA
ncbi:acyl-CoA dehydrogenase [Haloferax sp. DFSO60]|uniref:acyl-CoA dehydrogenase n=1 Tax=Haloferax sp. DFSO60 TaxID=3388652 RepID=UPI00397D278C